MCDCAEERARQARAAAEAEAKLRAAAQAEAAAKAKAEAAAKAKAEAEAKASKQAAPPRPCPKATRPSPPQPASTTRPQGSWFSRFLSLFSSERQRPIPHDCLKARKKPPEPGSRLVFWMGMLLGTIALYFCFASLMCALRKYGDNIKERLANFRAVACDPCATMDAFHSFYGEVRTQIGILSERGRLLINSVAGRSKPKACRPKPLPPPPPPPPPASPPDPCSKTK